MIIKENGEKWACESCLKGHRVANCTHHDRQLFFVPRKGRPASQCQHCRSQRKRNSAHVKCACGTDKPKRCPHLSEEKHDPIPANNPIAAVPSARTADAAPIASAGNHTDGPDCCCHHGEACICLSTKKKDSIKTEHIPAPRVQRPPLRANTTQSSDGHSYGSHSSQHKSSHRTPTLHDPVGNYRVHKHTSSHNHSVRVQRSVDDLASLVSARQFQTAQGRAMAMEALPEAALMTSDSDFVSLANPEYSGMQSQAMSGGVQANDNDPDTFLAFFNEHPEFDLDETLALDNPLLDYSSGLGPAVPPLDYASSNAMSDTGATTPIENQAFGAIIPTSQPLYPNSVSALQHASSGPQSHAANRWSMPSSLNGMGDELARMIASQQAASGRRSGTQPQPGAFNNLDAHAPLSGTSSNQLGSMPLELSIPHFGPWGLNNEQHSAGQSYTSGMGHLDIGSADMTYDKQDSATSSQMPYEDPFWGYETAEPDLIDFDASNVAL